MTYGPSVEKSKELRSRMLRLKIYEKDIQEDFIRSSGPGGQNVNKVSTCVVLFHTPSGIKVRSQSERTQGLNRFNARCILISKLEKRQRDEKQKLVSTKEKKRRQNRKRPRALKEKILESKRKQSLKKQDRRKIPSHKPGDM